MTFRREKEYYEPGYRKQSSSIAYLQISVL
jgi:hypothetical protein